MSPVLFCFVFHLGLCFHAFPIIINALIVYFTEKLNSWEFTDALLLLLLGAVIMSVMYKLLLRDCAVWWCNPVFSWTQHTGCKKEKKPTGNAP